MTLLEVYQRCLPNLKLYNRDKGEWRACCPFHEDDKPSFFVNEQLGLYYCFGCGEKGNVYQFLEKLGHNDLKTELVAVENIKSTFSAPISDPINPIIIQQLHRNLVNDRKKLEYLLRERMINFFTIKKRQLGYDPETDRYSIPISSFKGKYYNIKLHNSFKDPKSISWRLGNGKARIFPIDATLKSTITICEGEFDCLLLHSIGINAITNTAGAGTWEMEWNTHFTDKRVRIIYDSDNAGISGSQKVATALNRVASSIDIIRFPEISGRVGKTDVTDYVKAGGDIYKLLKIERKW
jgi:putative DNA primase/helicase